MSLEEFDKSWRRHCPFCEGTCGCQGCRDRIDKEERERKGDGIGGSCLNCQIFGRKRMLIWIECDTCHENFCLECLKAEEGFNSKVVKRWNCSNCKKATQKKKITI